MPPLLLLYFTTSYRVVNYRIPAEMCVLYIINISLVYYIVASVRHYTFGAGIAYTVRADRLRAYIIELIE